MPWLEHTPGVFQREIGENEKFIKTIGDRGHAAGREHWSITSKAKLKLPKDLKIEDLIQSLRSAWQALRFQHPSIASTATSETLQYTVPDESALKFWTKETLWIHHEQVSADELVATLQPSRYVCAHYLVNSQEILLHFAHWRTDGYGALQLINAFAEQLSYALDGGLGNMTWGDEARRLAPNIEEVLNIPVEPTPEIQEATDRCLATLVHLHGAVGVALQTAVTAPPGGTRSSGLRFTEATTAAIEKACAAHGISVLAAVHASCAAVTWANAARYSKNKHYTSTMRFSLRPHLPNPYNTDSFAAALYTGGYMAKVPASQSWIENAKGYFNEYQHGITPGFLQARRQYAIEVQKRLTAGAPPPSPPPSEIDISGADEVESMVKAVRPLRDGQALEVVDVGVGVETLTRQMYCFVWTFRKRLELSLVYNEAYYSAGYADGIVRALQEVLLHRLGLGEELVGNGN